MVYNNLEGLWCIFGACRPFKDLPHGVYTTLEGVR